MAVQPFPPRTFGPSAFRTLGFSDPRPSDPMTLGAFGASSDHRTFGPTSARTPSGTYRDILTVNPSYPRMSRTIGSSDRLTFGLADLQTSPHSRLKASDHQAYGPSSHGSFEAFHLRTSDPRGLRILGPYATFGSPEHTLVPNPYMYRSPRHVHTPHLATVAGPWQMDVWMDGRMVPRGRGFSTCVLYALAQVCAGMLRLKHGVAAGN